MVCGTAVVSQPLTHDTRAQTHTHTHTHIHTQLNKVTQLRSELAGGLLTPDQVAERERDMEQLTTLRESNAHLRAHNRELTDAAARREREAAQARAQLQPLRDQIT